MIQHIQICTFNYLTCIHTHRLNLGSLVAPLILNLIPRVLTGQAKHSL